MIPGEPFVGVPDEAFPVPRMSRNCFGVERRLIGQKRLPTPPAMMMQYRLLFICFFAVLSYNITAFYRDNQTGSP